MTLEVINFCSHINRLHSEESIICRSVAVDSIIMAEMPVDSGIAKQIIYRSPIELEEI